ncbi:MAG TPA: polymer-forming cytoskeletal protein [Bacteroidia bacterium]|nr:polymer-forming cytoskeletal protein [Bacteroidia bacterium]HRD38977.1 polymer-forming cytoskeletal protein [Bacteroidia bacterium]
MLGIGNKHSGSESGAINLIGSGTTINGDIQSSGDVRIDGTLTGNITLSGRLVIGPNGKIEGNVICQNADISGEIKGKVQIAEMLSLKATAKILGDIATGKISIEPGAVFTGTCNMGAIVKNINATGEKSIATKTA